MPDDFDNNKPLYGSRGIDIYLKLIKQKYSYVDIEELLTYASMEPYQVKDQGHFFSQNQINKFYEKLVDLTGNPKIAREAGRYASSSDAHDNVARFAIGFISPVKFYKLLGKYVNKISRSSTYEAHILSSNRVEIIVTPNPGAREESFQCENRMGYWEAISTLFKLKPSKIEHPECLFTGGKVCRYIVSWPKSPVTVLKAIRNTSLVLLGLVCILFPSLYYLKYPTQTSLLIFITLFAFASTFTLIINWALKRHETDNLIETIDLLHSSSDELIDQIDINYKNSLLIAEVAQILAKQSEPEGLFSEIIKVLHKRLDFDRILFMLANPEKTRLNYEAGFGYNNQQGAVIHKLSFHLDNPDSKGIFYVSFRDRKPILLNNINEIKDELSERSYNFAMKMDVKSLICCPITYEDESLGILAVDNTVNKRPLVQTDINLLMGIALQLGARLHNIKLESHLRQIQKMEAVGNLAGGIAHDFNNILTTILGYSQMLSLKIKDNNDLSKMADNIHYAGLKAASLTQQLLAFSRKQVLEMKVTNLNIITEDMTRMLGRLIGENIQLKMFLSEETGNIMADASQVGQILMNLVVNARDAMPDGGILTIETSEIYIENQYTTRHLYFKAGHYSMISITDTGRGMTPELRDKIFEPFFTTKGPGKGTGLGLSTVYGIVKQHNGYIHVYSEPDHGTCFKIYLPRVSGEIESLDVKEVFHMRGGSETILVVDDDDSIRSLIIDTLQPLGYNIIPASTGAEALELSRMIEQDIDLLLSDVIMPGINGKQLADIIVQEQPQIRVILMSGYTDNVIAHHGVLQSDYILINKPLLPLALTSKIREVLDHTQEIKNTETNVS